MFEQLQIELETERLIAQSSVLSAFHRNATSWELLLLLAANKGESDLGVYNTLDQLETGYLGQSAMLKFLRDRRSDGLLTFDEHEKRSKWRLRLSQELYDELTTLIDVRNHKLKTVRDQNLIENLEVSSFKNLAARHAKVGKNTK